MTDMTPGPVVEAATPGSGGAGVRESGEGSKTPVPPLAETAAVREGRSATQQIAENHRTGNFKRCPGRARHWNVYYGEVGTSTPYCLNCGAPNAKYRPEDDPRRGESWDDFLAEKRGGGSR